MGPDASRIREQICQSAPASTSMLFDESRRDAQAALIRQFTEATEQNADGYWGAVPSIETLWLAWNSLAHLPSELPVPDVTIHPDGEIAFEWLAPEGSILTTTIGEDRQMKWAAIIGGERVYGRLPYAESLPARLRRMVSQLVAIDATRRAG